VPVDAGVPDAGVSGEDCFTPATLALGAPVAVPLSSSLNDLSGASATCATGAGPDRVYAVSIGTNQRLTVMGTPQGAFDVGLSVANDAMSCAARSCLAMANASGAGGTETVTFDNTGPARTVWVIVDSMTLASGTVGLFATLSAINSFGDTCLNAVPINASTTLVSQSTNGFVKDYNPIGAGCVSPLGPEAVYAVTLAPNQTVTVVMTSPLDAAINIIAGPAAACATATTCLASADTGATGAETTSFTNGPTTQTVYVLLGRWGGATGTLTYDVSFTLTP
jgi:hypothetical protein